jgi:hypothetical protein
MATQAEALLYEVYLHAEHEEVGETPAQVSRPPPADPSPATGNPSGMMAPFEIRRDLTALSPSRSTHRRSHRS